VRLNENQLIKSMSLNALYKPIGMVISLLYTPLLLNYLGDEKYGVWATVLSIITWITFFDVGIGNGLRNIITIEVENEEYQSAKVSISTAYTVLTSIILIAYLVVVSVGLFINWSAVFNTNIEVKPVLFLSFTFICINFILAMQKVGYYAIQQSEKVALTSILTQLFNLVGVLIITAFNTDKLILMAMLFGLSSFVINILFSVLLWKKRPYFRPNPKLFNRDKLYAISSLGFKFFFIQIAALILFTTDSLIITSLYGPEKVTPYNTAFKAFGVFNLMFSALLAPLWARYTVAKSKNNYQWIKINISRMRLVLIPISISIFIAVLYFDKISLLWLGRKLDYDAGLIVSMGVYYVMLIYSSIYSSALNGIGNVNVQLVTASLMALINIPLSIYLAKYCGLSTTGVSLATIICMIIGNIVYTIQMNYIMKKNIEEGIT